MCMTPVFLQITGTKTKKNNQEGNKQIHFHTILNVNLNITNVRCQSQLTKC